MDVIAARQRATLVDSWAIALTSTRWTRERRCVVPAAALEEISSCKEGRRT